MGGVILKGVDIINEIADLKEVEYKNTLALVSVIELLIEKKIITRRDISKKADFLDNLTIEQLKVLNVKSK